MGRLRRTCRLTDLASLYRLTADDIAGGSVRMPRAHAIRIGIARSSYLTLRWFLLGLCIPTLSLATAIALEEGGFSLHELRFNTTPADLIRFGLPNDHAWSIVEGLNPT